MTDTASKLIVLSGLSGAGKTVALHTLEDLGYYCIDNIPMQLLPEFVGSIVEAVRSSYDHVAVGIDSRSPAKALDDVAGLVGALKNAGMPAEMVFLDANDDVLIKRFSETRRKHPLSDDNVPLAEAIAEERRLLSGLVEHANIHIDTSHSNIYQLRDTVRQRVHGQSAQNLPLMFLSFGFKRGIPPDADLVFDARCLPNPYWESQLRDLSGRDPSVATFLQGSPVAEKMFEDIRQFIEKWIPQYEQGNRAYMTVAIGCTGGQHRSVWLAERLSGFFSDSRESVMVRHRELDEGMPAV